MTTAGMPLPEPPTPVTAGGPSETDDGDLEMPAAEDPGRLATTLRQLLTLMSVARAAAIEQISI
jgi:hypothetical protein